MIALAQQSNILDFPSVAPQGKSNEWYTPARYIEAAREVMGSIDLDPASCEVANRTVRASRYYTVEDDGLAQEWYGNVWINPPYGLDRSQPIEKKSTIALWVKKLVEHYQARDIEQAILLATSQTNAKWFGEMWQYPICFADHNVRFILLHPRSYEPGRRFASHIFGTIFVYLGPNEQRFIEVFSQFGTIAKRVSQPRHTIATPSLWEVAQ